MTYIRTSIPGKSAYSSRDEDLSVNSRNRIFGVDSTVNPAHMGYLEYTFDTFDPYDGGEQGDERHNLLSFEHGLDYVPATVAYLNVDSFGMGGVYIILPTRIASINAPMGPGDGIGYEQFEFYADETHCYLDMCYNYHDGWSIPWDGVTIKVKYNVVSAKGILTE